MDVQEMEEFVSTVLNRTTGLECAK